MEDSLAEYSKLRNYIAAFIPEHLDARLKVSVLIGNDQVPCIVSVSGPVLVIYKSNEDVPDTTESLDIIARLYLPMCIAEHSGGTLSIWNNDKMHKLAIPKNCGYSNEIFEKFLALVTKRSLGKQTPRSDLQQGYNRLSLRFYASCGQSKYLYGALTGCLLAKTGPNKNCLPTFDLLLSHGGSFVIYYRINLELNKTPQLMSTLRTGLSSIVKQMCEVIADLARVGLIVQDFDPAEDTVMDNFTFQLISLSKIRLWESQEAHIDDYFERVSRVIKTWVSDFTDKGRFLDFDDLIGSIKDILVNLYENAYQRKSFLFSSHYSRLNQEKRVDAFVREATIRAYQESQLLTPSISHMEPSMIQRDLHIDNNGLDQSKDYLDLEIKPQFMTKTLSSKECYQIQLTQSTLDTMEADILEADLSLLEDIGSVNKKVSGLNSSDTFKKTLSFLNSGKWNRHAFTT